MKAIKVKLKEAEKIKKELNNLDLISKNYKIKKDEEYIYFPIECEKEKENQEIKNKNYELINENFEEIENTEKNLKSLMKRKLSDDELTKLKTSFDTVGDIAILEIDDELRNKEKIIAKALLESHKNIKTVLRKDDKHDGEFRTQKMKWIDGDKTKETIHKENNVNIKLNVETVYFSPRLSTERKRIAEQVQKDEEILVMFSGCAPYPCVLSKNTEAKHITGIELNPEGHEYGLKNIEMNKLNNVTLINGDVKTETTRIYKHIIGLKSSMNKEELKKKLSLNPKIFEFHLFEEDLTTNREELEEQIKLLKKNKLKIFIHMPFPKEKTSLFGDKKPEEFIKHLRIMGDICKKYEIYAIIHVGWELPEISEQELIKNIKLIKEYYPYFYFENGVDTFNKIETIINIAKKAEIKNICIDIAHLYIVYKNNDEIIKKIKEIQKHFNTYFHLSDSDGERDALEIDTGKINIDKILPYVTQGIAEIRSKIEQEPKEMINSYNKIISKKRTFDRILMPLPKNAENFLDSALNVAKRGTIIHFYNFLHETEFEEAEKKVKKACEQHNFKYKKLNFVKCGQQSPRTYRICLDFQVL